MKNLLSILIAALLIGGYMGSPDGVVPSAEAASAGLCDVFADGTLASGDDFYGQVSIDDLLGNAHGFWEHTVPSPPRFRTRCERLATIIPTLPESPGRDHLEALFRDTCEPSFFGGQVTTAFCLANGVTITDAFGYGTWNGAPAHSFNVQTVDGSPDTYFIEIADPDGTVVYTATGDVDTGDITAITY